MKYIKFLWILILSLPLMVMARDLPTFDGFTIIGESVKYYKTVSILNNSLVTASIQPELNSFTTEITKEEYDSVNVHDLYHLNDSTYIDTNYKSLRTVMYKDGTTFRYFVDLSWKNIPKVRSYDIIAIGHYSTVKPAGLLYFENDYCRSNGSCSTVNGFSEVSGDNGNAAVFMLPTGDVTTLYQSFYFDAEKSSSTTVKNQTAAGDYAHATKTITQSNARKLSVNIAGIIHDKSVEDYYDTIAPAIVDWSGSW